MGTTDLKKEFHDLIDNIDNERILMSFYDIIKSKVSTRDGQLWGRLNKQEQDELMMAFEESENPNHLIDHDIMREKHSKWLSK